LNRKVFIRLIVIAGGLGIILLSLFAFQLGLDNDPGWGARRIQLIGAGLGIILFGCLYWITPAVSRFLKFPVDQASNAIVPENENSYRRSTNIWLIIAGCFVLFLYVWIITVGRIEKWPSGRDYYWKLTKAFQQGQAYLLEKPNPALAELENPYDHHQRKGLEYLWDTTYYDGKYFLYWGPVPAVMGVMVSAVTARPVTDAGLVFSFVVGTALFSVLLLREIYKQFRIPSWAFWGGVFASMLNVPLIWLLTRPTFYEVSISGGQFFLMAGFYFLFLAFRNARPHNGLMAAAALTFGLAGATRINLLPSVVVLAVFILWRIYVLNEYRFSNSVRSFAAAILPLAFIACSLFWYNYIRFGSIFEFGHRYQLTGPSLTANYADISSIKYVFPNLYTYILRFPSISAEFPFFTVPWIKANMWPAFIHLPEHYYYTEPVAGILFVLPLIGLTVLFLIRWFWLAINGDILRDDMSRKMGDSLFSWFGLSLFAYIVVQLSILLVFINSAMRYLVDVSPALIVLSSMVVGYYIHLIERQPYMKKIYAALWILAATLTVVAGFLIGFTGDKNNFLNKNPHLYYQLVEWFKH
jgi:hypothetical protein